MRRKVLRFLPRALDLTSKLESIHADARGGGQRAEKSATPQPSCHFLGRFHSFLVLTALTASLAACSGMDRQPSPDNKQQFAPGWSEHARPLFFHGMGRDAGYNVWQVPNNLPSGTYRVIVRKSGPTGDMAELVDGNRFEIDATNKDIYLNILTNYANPEALEETYIIGLDSVRAK
jgi:hypothetical protein